jgi:hypothetical protein
METEELTVQAALEAVRDAADKWRRAHTDYWTRNTERLQTQNVRYIAVKQAELALLDALAAYDRAARH